MLIAGSSMREINNLKTRLSATFEMKNFGPAKQILGMKISWDRSAGTLNLSQELYIEKVLSRFRVNDAKPRTTLLANHFKLLKEQSPKTVEERKVTLQGFVDADLDRDVDSSKSTSGYIYTIRGTTIFFTDMDKVLDEDYHLFHLLSFLQVCLVILSVLS
uniref:Reverse transcriptase Ty1/copia-type domain-containing protein n=1 Tax=Solanum lycopersicum TaxID=4081 RepID=A0A3Q7EEM7_SOLLC